MCGLVVNVYKYTDLQNKVLPLLPLILALVYFVYAAFSVIPWFTKDNSVDSSIAVDSVETVSAPPEPVDLSVIKDWHLFGQAPTAAEKDAALAIAEGGKLPETQLQLKLLGVFFVQGQKNAGYAIIQSGDNQQKSYKPGDELPGGATLQTLASEQVVLKHNGQLEALSMDRQKGLFAKK